MQLTVKHFEKILKTINFCRTYFHFGLVDIKQTKNKLIKISLNDIFFKFEASENEYDFFKEVEKIKLQIRLKCLDIEKCNFIFTNDLACFDFYIVDTD